MGSIKNLPLLFLCPILGGCNIFGVDQGFEIDGVEGSQSYWMSYDATRRASYFLGDDSQKVRILGEPAPDAVASTAINLLAKGAASEKSGDATIKLDYARTASELTSRHQTVLVLREALYRLSELHVNKAFKDQETVEVLFKETLGAVVNLAKAEYANSLGIKELTTRLSKLEAEQQKAEADLQEKQKLLSDLNRGLNETRADSETSKPFPSDFVNTLANRIGDPASSFINGLRTTKDRDAKIELLIGKIRETEMDVQRGQDEVEQRKRAIESHNATFGEAYKSALKALESK